MNKIYKARGFTMLELVIAMGVIAVLGFIGVIGYQKYTERAKAADIVVKYDAIRSGAGAEIAQGAISRCAEVAQRLGDANLADDYARLGYGFESVSGGYRPVLTVCATADRNGPLGVKVARGAHDTLAKTAHVEKGAVLTDTLVSFAVPLIDSDKPVCTVPVANPTSACGDPAPAQAQSAASGHACPPGQEWASHSSQSGATVSGCVTACKPGEIRDPNNWRWCIPEPPPAQAAASITCPPGNDKVLVPASLTPTGKAAEACFRACPAGQMRSLTNPLQCVAAAPAQVVTGVTPLGVQQQPARPVPNGMKAGTTPNAPWVHSAPNSVGIVPMTHTWTESQLIGVTGAISPDRTSPVKVIGIEVDPAKATVTHDPDGRWRVNFLKSYQQGAQTILTIRVSNGAGENSGQFVIRGH